MLQLDEKFSRLFRSGNPTACNQLLDESPPGRNQEEKHSIAYWRAVLLDHEGRHAEALAVLNASASGFNCQSLFALKKAEVLRSLDRILEAIAALRAAPIAQEVATFPGLAWEAAYFCCYLMAKQGEAPPKDLLDLIPDDFETVLDGRFIAKSNLTDGRL